MPRISPLRLAILSTVWACGSWLSLALAYAFLPSTQYGWDLESSQHLSTGAKVTRVYNTDDWFDWHDGKPSVDAVREAGRECFALDYQFEYIPAMKTSLLHLGPSVSIDLHDFWSRLDLSQPLEIGQDLPSYVSDPIEVDVKIGDLDGINLNWFRRADAMLLFYAIHQENITLPLRIRVYEKLMQLWPDTQRWETSGNPTLSSDDPLLEIYNIDHFNGTKIQSKMPVYNYEPVSMSPSRTFIVRKNIQAILVPTGLWVHHHTGFIREILSLIGTISFVISQVITFVLQLCLYYGCIVAVYWIISGRPAFGPWAQSVWLTRKLFAKVQNARQYWPAHDERAYDATDDECRPYPLRGPLDFFRSSNPLDDLLVTFECTKRFLEPIRFGKKSIELGEEGQVSMPNEIKLDVSHTISRPDRAQRKERSWDDLEKGTT